MVAVPADLVDRVAGGGGPGTLVALSVEVPARAVTVIGAAGSISLGVLDPAAPFPSMPQDSAPP